MTIGQVMDINLLGSMLLSATDKENDFLKSMHDKYLKYNTDKAESLTEKQGKWLKDIMAKYPEEVAIKKINKAYGDVLRGKRMDDYDLKVGSNFCCGSPVKEYVTRRTWYCTHCSKMGFLEFIHLVKKRGG